MRIYKAIYIMISLLIASSQLLFSMAIAHLTRERIEKTAIEYAENGEELLVKSQDTFFDLIIVDNHIAGMSTLELLLLLKNRSLISKVLVVSLPPDEYLLQELINMGVKGFLSLSADVDDYAEAVDNMLHKHTYVPTEFTEIMLNGPDRHKSENLNGKLSKRERQVMLQIAAGESIKDIAAQLNLSDKTISTYKARIFQKMNFENTAQLIKYVLSKNIN